MFLFQLLLLFTGAALLIAIFGQKSSVEYSPSLGLLAILLLVIPFRWGFTVHIGSYSMYVPFFTLLGIAVFLLIERKYLCDFFITQQNLLYALLDGIVLSVISLLLVNLVCNILTPKNNLQFLNIVPVDTFLSCLRVGVTEELLFRGFLLGYLRRFHFTPTVANLIQTAYFAVGHMRYLENGNFGAMGLVIGLSLLSGYITLHRKNVVGAIVFHIAINMLYLN